MFFFLFSIFFFFLVCDFYQNTEIRHAHKPARRPALFTARLAPAHLASCLQGAWERRSATSVGRGNEAEEKQGKSRETGRGETDQKRQQGDSPQRVRGWKTSSLPKDPQNIAESGEGQRQGKIEARRKTGRGGGRGGAVLVVEMERTPNPSCSPNTCRFPLSCQHIRFPQTPLPTQALSHPSTLPWTQAIHPNTGGQNKPF